MGSAKLHKKVKLIIGFIFKNGGALNRALVMVKKRWGQADSESGEFDFYSTDYYRGEMGDGLKKKFISMERLVRPEDIYNIKTAANRIEKMLSINGRRSINIDPGYITESKLILLTTKDHGHRIYLRNGIYAEITLKYQKGGFEPLETTYPDYRNGDYINFFNNARLLYREEAAIAN